MKTLDSIVTPEIYYSNRIETLLDALAANLFSKASNAFTRRLVIVSSQAMEQWVRYRLANDSRLAVLMGVQVVSVARGVDQLLEKQESVTWDQSTLVLRIESELRLAVMEDDPVWLPLHRSLALDSEGLNPRTQRRLCALAQHLAKLFQQYGIYGGREVVEWQADTSDWQKRLWLRIFSLDGWDYQAAVLESWQGLESKGNFQVHLFGLAFLPRCQQEFFKRLGEQVPTSTYVLSPCRAFWTDIQSDRESRRLQRYWKDRGASFAQMETLDLLLRDRNPLLANFGRLGREYHRQLELLNAEEVECYELSGVMLEHMESIDEDVRLDEMPPSLLRSLQADLLLLRQGCENPIAFDEWDQSIEIHKAPSRWREVEILYNNILRRIHEADEVLHPHEILVMAPNIMDYAPSIEAIFGSAESPLDYQIMDVDLATHSSYFQGFFALFELAQGRWELPAVVDFLEHPFVQHRLGWGDDELLRVRAWLERVGVTWGMDAAQRDAVLSFEECPRGMQDASGVGTWEFALRRMLRGLVLLQDEDVCEWDTLPLEGLELTDGELLGQFVQWVRTLFRDLRPVVDGSQRSLPEWLQWVESVTEKYLEVPRDDRGGARDRELALNMMQKMSRAVPKLGEASYGFMVIEQTLREQCAQETRTVHEHLFHGVRFCSLVPMRSIPSRAIFLLGMDKDSFPRRDDFQSLNLLLKSKEADYCPSRTDFDRYLFLEALLSARDHLAISYQSYSHSDWSELFPSTVLSELINYLNKAYTVGGQSFEDLGIIEHPFTAYDTRYYSDKSSLQGYSERAYSESLSLQSEDKKPRCFVAGVPIEETSEKIIDVRELLQASSNPIKVYLNEALGMYLQNEKPLPSEEPLALNALDRYLFRSRLLHSSVTETLHRAEGGGGLPLGIFKEVARQQLSQDSLGLKQQLEKLGIGTLRHLDVELALNCRAPIELKPGSWVFPAMQLGCYRLVGRIQDVSEQGVISLSQPDLARAIRAWPRFLLFSALIKQYDLPWKPQMLFLKKAKALPSFLKDPAEDLRNLVEYSQHCSREFCPLLPEWVSLLFKEDPLPALMATLNAGSWGPIPNAYALWVFEGAGTDRLSAAIEPMRERANLLWGGILEHWFKPRGRS